MDPDCFVFAPEAARMATLLLPWMEHLHALIGFPHDTVAAAYARPSLNSDRALGTILFV